jgi:integrase
MPDLPLNKAGIEGLPLPEKNAVDYRDKKQRALWLRVSPAGTKSWCVRYKQAGKSQRENIGRFPEIPITYARELAAQALTKIAKGADLGAERKAAQEARARQALETVAAVGEAYFKLAPKGLHRLNGKPKRSGSVHMERVYFDRHLIPRVGARKLSSLTRFELQKMVEEIEAETSPSAARHSRNVLHRIFSFAIWQDIVAIDPTNFVATTKTISRERTLTDDELRALWQCLDTAPTTDGITVSPAITIAIKLAAVTLQRRAEVVEMSHDEIDRAARIWTIPGRRTKNGRTHVVPLSDLALRLLDDAVAVQVGKKRGSPFLFPSSRTGDKPMRPVALNIAWYRSVVRSDKPSPIGADGRLRITPHDLRRTGATAITSERIGMPRFIVSQVLNHTSDSGGTAAVTAVYDRNAYLKEKRAALNAWADLLLEIVEGKARPSNVVQLAR